MGIEAREEWKGKSQLLKEACARICTYFILCNSKSILGSRSYLNIIYVEKRKFKREVG